MANDKNRERSNEQRAALAQHIIDSFRSADVRKWHAGWSAASLSPRNGKSGRTYNGVNRMWLAFLAMSEGYTDARWYTFDSIKYAKGLHLAKGSHGTWVEFWKPKAWYKRDADGYVLDEDGNKQIDHWYMKLMAMYPVFNGSQIEGLDPVHYEEQTDAELFAIADEFIGIIERDGKYQETAVDEACYMPTENKINMPLRGTFASARDFCATLFHEFAHSTKAATRMGRTTKEFETHRAAYAYEELVAELSSLFIQSDLGFDTFGATTENSMRYLKFWADATADEDTTAQIMSAITEAQRVSDWVMEQYEALTTEAAA